MEMVPPKLDASDPEQVFGTMLASLEEEEKRRERDAAAALSQSIGVTDLDWLGGEGLSAQSLISIIEQLRYPSKPAPPLPSPAEREVARRELEAIAVIPAFLWGAVTHGWKRGPLPSDEPDLTEAELLTQSDDEMRGSDERDR
jgi:hypothetical protein